MQLSIGLYILKLQVHKTPSSLTCTSPLSAAKAQRAPQTAAMNKTMGLRRAQTAPRAQQMQR